MNKLLIINELKTHFMTGKQDVKAVNGVSFHIERNEILAVVGESGSGKSVTAKSILRLIKSPGKIVAGEILYDGRDMLRLKEKEMTSIRGNRISMVYQEPMTSLNPIIPVGDQISEALIIHKKAEKKEAKSKAIELMEAVKIPEAAMRYKELPEKFSGGMRQRVIIAMAIACNPELLIADEPTTALDVTIQAEIMDLIKSLKNKNNMSVMLITHDLGLVAENADRVIVMYCGKVMEEAVVGELFSSPLHPYTMGLIQCIPRIDAVEEKLYSIPGYVPHPSQLPEGCPFSDRCHKVMDICRDKMPELKEIHHGHKARCWLY